MNTICCLFEKERRKVTGFTFIEILVVVTIIAMLVVIAAVSYGSINKRSRDARRKSDIEQLRSALEMYRADYSYYPDEGPSSFTKIAEAGLSTPLESYIATFPQDPKDNSTYAYQIIMTNQLGSPAHYYGYCLAAYTEAEGSASNSCGIDLPDITADKKYNYGVKNP
jgi:prepilin-type N-terminal cleavage/methylation domain-containing protein